MFLSFCHYLYKLYNFFCLFLYQQLWYWYKFSHFLGYGVIVPEKELKKSPYFQDVLENKFYHSNNIIQLDYNHYDNDEVFIGFKLDVLDEHFQERSKSAEKGLNQLYQDIMKVDIPAKYEPKMYAKYGYIWEEE